MKKILWAREKLKKIWLRRNHGLVLNDSPEILNMMQDSAQELLFLWTKPRRNPQHHKTFLQGTGFAAHATSFGEVHWNFPAMMKTSQGLYSIQKVETENVWNMLQKPMQEIEHLTKKLSIPMTIRAEDGTISIILSTDPIIARCFVTEKLHISALSQRIAREIQTTSSEDGTYQTLRDMPLSAHAKLESASKLDCDPQRLIHLPQAWKIIPKNTNRMIMHQHNHAYVLHEPPGFLFPPFIFLQGRF